MKTYNIKEIRNYIEAQASLGDVLYFLTEENIDKANEPSDEDLEEVVETNEEED